MKAVEVDELAHAVAGAGGGALSMALTMPLVTIATRLQVKDDSAEQAGICEKVKEIYRKEGITGFYSGLESAMYGMALTSFIYYYFYEVTSRATMRVRKKERLGTLDSMFSGTIAGSMTAIASNPIWVVNTRMMVAKSDRSTFSVFLDILQNDGFLTLFNGLKPALVLVANPIIQYTVFEQLKNFLLEINNKEVLAPSWAFLLGAIGKLAATGVTYPYIILKTRMHLAKGEKKASNMWELALQTMKKEGFSGFYHGIGVKLIQSIFTAAFLFYFKEGLVIWSVRVLRLFRRYNQRIKNYL
ncbi:uncharacterized protein Ecym_4630 [Eremothecium cymbalariae DBVPG|uniref:Mitochondrial carrier protein n=1 Tax=Eremothecium cymbalariae (strain CBS 270.75 / DBVPG 7215 / KCTC 17166 / NRRL Y-17582) TaxID=931890 RepID=G8JSD3_ERECY|nr:hypothetical protein Ecym_4630 [Eremothecium cymbalariae DBVPG\